MNKRLLFLLHKFPLLRARGWFRQLPWQTWAVAGAGLAGGLVWKRNPPPDSLPQENEYSKMCRIRRAILDHAPFELIDRNTDFWETEFRKMAIEKAKANEGGVVGIYGPPNSGRSSLLAELPFLATPEGEPAPMVFRVRWKDLLEAASARTGITDEGLVRTTACRLETGCLDQLFARLAKDGAKERRGGRGGPLWVLYDDLDFVDCGGMSRGEEGRVGQDFFPCMFFPALSYLLRHGTLDENETVKVAFTTSDQALAKELQHCGWCDGMDLFDSAPDAEITKAKLPTS